MHLPPRLGLNRLMSFDERKEVESHLEISFQDIYDALDNAHFEARELEKLLNAIFRGSETETR